MKINTGTFSFESMDYLSYFQKKNNYNQFFTSNQEMLGLNYPTSEILFMSDGKGGCCNKKIVEDNNDNNKKSNDKDDCCDVVSDEDENKGCCDTNSSCKGGCCCR